MILLIDNYDSFVHNLARYFQRLGQETLVVRNDATTAGEVRRLAPAGDRPLAGPLHADRSRLLGRRRPRTVAARCRSWASASAIRRSPPRSAAGSSAPPSRGTAARRSSSTTARGCSPACRRRSRSCRYHSLVVDEATLPAELRVTARADDGAIMALEHATQPLFGVQFHPEAVLTRARLRAAGQLPAPGRLPRRRPIPRALAAERAPQRRLRRVLAPPRQPVTF